jgi:hypothetical protein
MCFKLDAPVVRIHFFHPDDPKSMIESEMAEYERHLLEGSGTFVQWERLDIVSKQY